MPDRTNIYIDGESHYIRSEAAWREIHGSTACLTRLRYSGQANDPLVLVNEKAKIFWTKRMNPAASRSVYFTSTVADEVGMHAIGVSLRDFNLEPHVIHERSPLAERRANILRDSQLIEKPKGVDIALAVRMLVDASNRAFEVCHLYTSDVDFLPVIKAVMSYGIRVVVFGYKNGLAKNSNLLTGPDLFVDLEEMLRQECELAPEK